MGDDFLEDAATFGTQISAKMCVIRYLTGVKEKSAKKSPGKTHDSKICFCSRGNGDLCVKLFGVFGTPKIGSKNLKKNHRVFYPQRNSNPPREVDFSKKVLF